MATALLLLQALALVGARQAVRAERRIIWTRSGVDADKDAKVPYEDEFEDPHEATGTVSNGDPTANVRSESSMAWWKNGELRRHAIRQTFLNVPTLTLKGEQFMHLAESATAQYEDPGADCIEHEPISSTNPGDERGTLETHGFVDLSTPGEYVVSYICKSKIHPGYYAPYKTRTVLVGERVAAWDGKCGVGMYPYTSEDGHKHCRNCAPGQYNSVQGATECKDCETGRYQLRSGQMTCKKNPCRPGSYLNQLTEACTACPVNTYSGVLVFGIHSRLKNAYVSYGGVGGCTVCGHSKDGHAMYRYETGGEFVKSCRKSECLPGTYQRPSGCAPCPINTYQAFFGQLHCIDCPQGTRTPTLSGNVRCVDHDEVLNKTEIVHKYLKPRTCSAITCDISRDKVTGVSSHLRLRGPYRQHARMIVHHGKEGGQFSPVKELHGMKHKCAMYDQFSKCTCICWFEPDGYDQWKAVRTGGGAMSYKRFTHHDSGGGSGSSVMQSAGSV
jgi:hypothetical protein